MKAENGGISPDYCESAMGALALARERCGLDSGSAVRMQNPQQEKKSNWKALFSKLGSVYNKAA